MEEVRKSMLYNLLYFVIGLTFCMLAFNQGYKAGYRAERKGKEKLTELPKIKSHEKRAQERSSRKATARQNAILENINNYDGTGKNQKEIK